MLYEVITVFQARAHKFEGALEAALHNNGVPVAVYEQLIEAVHEMLPVLKKYLAIRKRVMKVDQLEMYDLYRITSYNVCYTKLLRIFGVMLIGVSIWMISRIIDENIAMMLWGALAIFVAVNT